MRLALPNLRHVYMDLQADRVRIDLTMLTPSFATLLGAHPEVVPQPLIVRGS